MHRVSGPYTIKHDRIGRLAGERDDPDVVDINTPPPGQPGLWCNWIPVEQGRAIEWNEGEKFYNAAEWMAYLIDHFLRPGALASQVDSKLFEGFTFDHIVNGQIEAQGEDSEDRWVLIVEDNEVSVAEATFHYGDAKVIQMSYPDITSETQRDTEQYWIVTERTLVAADSEEEAIERVVNDEGVEVVEQSATPAKEE